MLDRTVPARFANKVTVQPDGCWHWTAGRTPDGYGKFWSNGGYAYAHRWAYELLVGPIPDGLALDHLCRVRHCVNPQHLEPVTTAENASRGEGITAANERKTHCLRGHEFTPENTYERPEGRRCRTCRSEQRAARRRR